SFLSWVIPEERERLNEYFTAFTPQQPIHEIEQRNLGPDGKPRWQHWTDRAIFDEQGRVIEFQSTGRDITERKQREQELALLNEISQQLIKLIAPEAIFETLFNAIGRVLDNRNLYIALYDETTGVVSFPLYTVDGERRPVASRPVGNGLTEHVLRLKEPVLIRSDMPAALREQGIALIGRESACYLGVPMLSGERAIGVLAIQDYERDAVYTERHVELFTTIAAQAAFALENARLFAAQARRVHELDTIAAVSAALRSAPTRADMLPIILDQVIDLMNCDTAALGFVSPVTGELVIEMGRGELASSTVGESFKIGEGIGGYVAATGQPYVANDLHNDPRIVKTHLLVSTRALACVPLIAQAQTIGVLWVGRAHTEVNQDTFTQDEVHLITAIADIAANAVRRAALHEETRRRVERLQALHTIDIAIGSSLDLHLTLNILLDQTLAQLEIAAACIFLFRPVTQTLHYAAGRGFRTRSMEQMKLHIADSLAGQAVLNRRAVRLDNIAETRERFKRISLLAVENLTAYYAMPLFAKGHVKGIIEFYNHSPMPIDPDWLDFAETLAGQAAIAIDNLTLFDELQRSNTELSLAYDTTLEGWSHALDLRDEETEGHSQRVTEMAVRIGQAMNLAETEIINLRRGALLHDIGKMGVPDSILHKPGKLSDEEWAVMHKHPEYAYNLLKPIAFLNSALDIPYCHHEKWDGTGYPRGLRGAEIPLAARIFAVADVSDALSNDRPYRPAWPPDKVRAYVIEQSGKHFDPQVVEVFLKLSD
ncbi:MAG TPA: GAF domain-containing protein, partial [Anaerolineales bacterium]|nr:GAF domain-containing protein [Anaerolineales bacterium]